MAVYHDDRDARSVGWGWYHDHRDARNADLSREINL